MSRSVALAGILGLALLGAGMVVGLTSANSRTSLVAGVVMVTGLLVFVLASFGWARAPTARRPGASRRSLTAAAPLRSARGAVPARRQPLR